MEASKLFATAVPEEQLEDGWDRALRRLFGPSQCLRSVESPRDVGNLPAIVQGRMQEHWQKGRGFSSCGQWEEAIICYTKAINLDPQRAELYEQRAEAFLQLCDFQSAKLNLMKVLALAPAQEQHCLARLALVLDLQGQCLLDQELYSEALESFTQAAELQPHCRVFHQRSIVCLAALGEFPEFLRVLNRELEEDVRNPDMYVLRAFFYKRFGQLALCHQDIQRALELEPQHRAAQALWQRLLRQGQEAKAQAVLKALCGDLRGALYEISFAIESDPLAAEFFTLRGTLLRQLKNFSAASKDLARARELSTVGSPEAWEVQRQLVLTYNDCAVHCYALGQLDEAVKLLGEALQNERTEQGLYANRGGKWLGWWSQQGNVSGLWIMLGCHTTVAGTQAVNVCRERSCSADLWQKQEVGQLGSSLILIPVHCEDTFTVSVFQQREGDEEWGFATGVSTPSPCSLFWGTAGNCCSPPDQAACAGCCSAELLAMMLKPGVGWTRGVCFPLALDKALGQQPAPLSC
ncbi:tetratricopeptide repeat protein 16 isoform X2 [Phasianus colchicus]|uniref:tetratricopeptide repeat protein 16 isoform X2 n=1 Tax=Phasianus colchicus TaxID=9054 RepID=UPI00129E9083|nr:tetratricopeptide repeat protein 16 isoform X2 [Phasianus colchicus]